MPRDIGGGPTSLDPVKDPKQPRQPVGTEPHVQQQKAGNNPIADPVLRETVARNIAHRVSQFKTSDIEKHPHTVASLVHSSISNQDLTQIARRLNDMYEYVRARNSQFTALHDPDQQHPALAEAAGAAAIWERAKRDPNVMAQMVEATQGAAAEAVGEGDSAIVTAGHAIEGAMRPISAGLAWTGDTLDDLGDIPVVGYGVRAVHSTLDVAMDVAGQNLARAGRLIGNAAAIPGMEIAAAQGHETDWGALLDFWRLERHDANTVAAANILGKDVDDPDFQETAQALDVVFGTVEQIALGKSLGAIGEWVRLPKNMGGALDAATIADHNILNGGLFTKLARLYEKSPPTTRVGRTLASTRRMDPRLAKVMADAYEFGETKTAKILSMKEAFVDYIRGNMRDLLTRQKDLNARLAEDPGNAALIAERARLESIIEQVSKRNPIGEWPRYQAVRGAMKGAPGATRVARYFKAIYDRRPAKAITDITKFTDNLRDRFRVWDWTNRKAPRDAVRMNAQSLGRVMRASGVPEETIAIRLGEMLDSTTLYSEWYMHVTHDIVEAAKSWADPVSLKRIESSLRNDEMFSNRANYSTQMIDPKTGQSVTVRRPVIEKPEGTHAPTQMNEMSHGARMAPLQDIRDISSGQLMAKFRQNPTVRWLLKAKDNAMATWRAMTIVSRGPAISMAIQSEEGLTAFFTNTPIKGVRRGIDFVVTRLPLTEAAQDAAARRLGFADVHEARKVYAALKKDPEQLGQMLSTTAEETTLRIEVPAKDFNTRFMNGQLDMTSREVRESFSDLTWQIEHTATDPMSRTLLNYGAERTARLMEGTGGVGEAPIPEGAVRLWSERRASELPRLRERGIVADAKTSEGGRVVWSQERVEGTNASRVRNGELPDDLVMVEHWATPEEVRRVGTMGADAVQTGDVPLDRIVRIWEGGKGAPTRSPTMEAWGEAVLRHLDEDPSYVGTPHEKLVDFLERKESEFRTLAGDHPDVLDLMASGRTSKFRLEDPDAEMDVVTDELQQGHLNLQDPETPAAQRLSLIERRNELLRRGEAPDATFARRLKVSKNNRAITNWLMKEASEGRYKLPETRWRRVTKSGYEDATEIKRGALSKINKVSYATMKYMNRDFMRAGFAEAKYVKWLKRYRRAGWREGDARAAASAQAAFEVRDWLHDIGNKSSFQRFFRNEAPFYHAWERVAFRWVSKVPNYMGAGFTPLGWAIEMNVVRGMHDALKAVGVIHEVDMGGGETREAVYLPNPLALLNWLPGFEAPGVLDVLDPQTVLFPPRHLLGHMPGLAPQAIFALDQAADFTHATWLRDLHNELTHDGAFDIRFPGSTQATMFWEAITGDVPPWSIGHSREYQEYVVGRARDASLRYAYTQLANEGTFPPDPSKFEDREAYAEARDRYWAHLTSTADDYHTGLGLTYLLATESPLSSYRPTSEEEVAWRQFLAENGLNGPRDQHDWNLIEDYLGEHPSSFAYNISMYDKTSKWPTDPGYEAFREAVANNEIRIANYSDYKATLALDQQWAYRNEAEDTALKKAGLGGWDRKSPQWQLLHWGEYKAATAPVWKDFNDFLDENPASQRLYERFRTPTMVAHDRIQEIEDQRYDLIHAGRNPDQMKQAVYDRLARQTEYGDTKSEHTAWYRHVVMNDWYDKTRDIYARIGELEDSKVPNANDLIAHQYDRLRHIAATWPVVTSPDGKRWPAPEVYYYAQKYPEEQLQDREEWAAKPPAWLTPFQYETVYGKPDGKVKQYWNAEEKVQNYFDAKTEDIAHSSTEYQQWVKWRETSLDILARRADVMEVRKLEKAPPIVRLQAAGLTPDSEGMDWIVDMSKSIVTKLNAGGSSMWSSSEEAQYYRGWLESYISRMRDPNSPMYDVRVDRFFTRKAHETGITYEPALYRFVLFGITGTFELDLDFSAEDKAARN